MTPHAATRRLCPHNLDSVRGGGFIPPVNDTFTFSEIIKPVREMSRLLFPRSPFPPPPLCQSCNPPKNFITPTP